MSAPAQLLGQVPPFAAYAVLGAVILAETVLLVGAFVPTLTVLVTAGALCRAGTLSLPAVLVVCVAAVLIGDGLGHRTGRMLGARLRTGRLGRRVPEAAWLRAASVLGAHGGRAVFVCRFVPVLRTVAPCLAGAVGPAFRRIAPYSAAGAVLWAGAEAGAGYAAAHLARYGRAAPLVGAAVAAVVAVVAVALATRKAKGRREGRAVTRSRTRAWPPVVPVVYGRGPLPPLPPYPPV